MDVFNLNGFMFEEYMDGIVVWRIDFYLMCGIVFFYVESIQLIKGLGVKFILELKFFSVSMLFDGDYS